MTIKETDKHILGEVISKDLAKFVTEMGSGSHELRKKIIEPMKKIWLIKLCPLNILKGDILEKIIPNKKIT